MTNRQYQSTLVNNVHGKKSCGVIDGTEYESALFIVAKKANVTLGDINKKIVSKSQKLMVLH